MRALRKRCTFTGVYLQLFGGLPKSASRQEQKVMASATSLEGVSKATSGEFDGALEGWRALALWGPR